MPRRHKKSSTRFIRSLIEKHGQEYSPALLPKDIQRGQSGKCFDWCALQCARLWPKYQYVEGVATDPDNPGEWILHAWLSDGQQAFDPTWKCTRDSDGKEVPLPCVYIGIPMDMYKVWDFMKATGYQGVFGNRWRNPELADRAIKSKVGGDGTK